MKPKKIRSGRSENPQLLHQLDLTTGYHTIHRIDAFSPPLVDTCRGLLPHGGLLPIYNGQFNVSIRGPRFTLFHYTTKIHEGGIGIGCDSTWIELHGIIENLGWTLEANPRDGLWLAEIPLSNIYDLEDEPIDWVFDFLRHLAAAMVSSDSNRPV